MAVLQEVTLAQLETLLYEIANYYGIARKNGDGSYHCVCPLHGGSDSLHVSATDKIRIHCFGDKGECTQLALRERLEIDGFDLNVVCYQAREQGKKAKPAGRIQNIPAHDQTALDIRTLSIAEIDKSGQATYYPVTAAWPYVDTQGQVIFYVTRADTPTGKLIRPYSSFSDEKGQSFWDFGTLISTKRPLFNLQELANSLDKPVLMVEGEKTCAAAIKQFPDYVCTTFPFGMANFAKVDFTPLKGRKVVIWPDNSIASINNFLTIAQLIDPLPRIVMTAPLEDRSEDWDLADEVTDIMVTSASLLEHAQTVSVQRVSPEGFEAAAAKYNAFLRILKIGGSTWVYDNRTAIDDTWLPYDYTSFGDITRIYSERIINPLAGPKSRDPFMFAVKAWEMSETKTITYGIAYEPSTTDEIIVKAGHKYVNKFMGFDYPAVACDLTRYICFPEHIYHIMDKPSADYLLAFIAHIIQKPKEKPGVLPILIGAQATGKTIIGKVIRAMLGSRNVYICDGRTFNSKWSGQFSGKLLVVVNEYTTEKQDNDFMNTFITDSHLTLEHKGKPIVSEESFHRVIGTTNSVHFKLSLDDRRYFPIRIHNPSINSAVKNEENKAYFNALDRLIVDEEGLCGLHDYLANYKTPVDVQLVPQTTYRYEGMIPVNPVHAIMLEICDSGSMPDEFGLIYQETQVPPYTPQYPSKVLRKHMRTMVKAMTKTEGPKVSHFLMEFLAPEKMGMHSNIQMKFIRRGSTTTETDNDRIFEFPPLEELRARYNRLVDPKRIWGPPLLRVVKDDGNNPI